MKQDLALRMPPEFFGKTMVPPPAAPPPAATGAAGSQRSVNLAPPANYWTGDTLNLGAANAVGAAGGVILPPVNPYPINDRGASTVAPVPTLPTAAFAGQIGATENIVDPKAQVHSPLPAYPGASQTAQFRPPPGGTEGRPPIPQEATPFPIAPPTPPAPQVRDYLQNTPAPITPPNPAFQPSVPAIQPDMFAASSPLMNFRSNQQIAQLGMQNPFLQNQMMMGGF